MTDVPIALADYFDALPEAAREPVWRLRTTILAEVDGAGEKISYGVPTVTLAGRNLLHYGGYAKHVSVYPIPDATAVAVTDPDLADAMAPYVAGKGTLKFPLNAPVPYDLITRVARAFVAMRG